MIYLLCALGGHTLLRPQSLRLCVYSLKSSSSVQRGGVCLALLLFLWWFGFCILLFRLMQPQETERYLFWHMENHQIIIQNSTRVEDAQGEKRPPSGFLCWIQSYQLRGKKTQTSQTPTIFYFNFSRFESEPSQGICPRKARKVRCGLCNGPGSLGTRRCPATAPCDSVTVSPAREQPPILPKQQVLVKYLFSAWLGALGWKPRPVPIERWMELLYSTLPVGGDLPDGAVWGHHVLQGSQLCVAQV